MICESFFKMPKRRKNKEKQSNEREESQRRNLE
jgi:hypothetical protein